MTNFPKGKLKVSSESVGAMGVNVRVRDLEFKIDEPVHHGGTNLGPSPVETAVSALSSCVSIIIRVIAKKHGFDVSSIETSAETVMDLRGILFMEETDTPFVAIKLVIDLEAELTDQQLARMQEDVRSFCPLYRLFSQAGTEIEESWCVTAPAVN